MGVQLAMYGIGVTILFLILAIISLSCGFGKGRVTFESGDFKVIGGLTAVIIIIGLATSLWLLTVPGP